MAKSFTLSEVLIILGTIGIVAAMTLPALIQHRQKIIIETRLKKFYTSINQALIMSEIKYGDKENWYIQNNEDFYETYLKENLATLRTEDISNNEKLLYLKDGSGVILNIYHACPSDKCGGHIVFCSEVKYCQNGIDKSTYGSKQFLFAIGPTIQIPVFAIIIIRV